jgi:hypothetical protein
MLKQRGNQLWNERHEVGELSMEQIFKIFIWLFKKKYI